MEEKRGKNGCTHFQVWVESEEGAMVFMKRLVFGFLVFIISVSVAWAGERGYQLVAGRGSKLCARVLEAFREDMDDQRRLRYQHEILLTTSLRFASTLRGTGLASGEHQHNRSK